ncbi:hypothetical protein BFW01_g10903 [Lasiodiplodia theobromae]|uniref:Uncharacterized protein n=1 Tax=Lasiodiplodia theobromae TaxID=45133 RepID=A0A8H7IQ36_9PEZI|nr:hypothetical protein BFW01_g10903 [Lasiodiplodia theobromae]
MPARTPPANVSIDTAFSAAPSRKPKPTSPDYRSSFPPVQTGVYRTYPIDVNAFSPPAPATPAPTAVRPPLSSSSSYSSRKQVRIKEDRPSLTSFPSSSSSDYSTSEDDRSSGIDASQRRCQARGNGQVRGKEGARHVGVSLSSSSLPLSYNFDDETETETEPERMVKERRRRRRRRGETGRMRRRHERKLSELRSEKERSKARTDEGKHDTWPAMLDLAAFFATYVLT